MSQVTLEQEQCPCHLSNAAEDMLDALDETDPLAPEIRAPADRFDRRSAWQPWPQSCQPAERIPALHTMALDDAIQNLQGRDSRAWDVGLSALERSIIIDALYQSIDNAYRTYGRRVNESRIGAIEALIVKLLGWEAAQ